MGFFSTLPERCLAISDGKIEALKEVAVFADKLGHVADLQSDVLFIKGVVATALVLGDDPDTIIMCCGFAFFGTQTMNILEFRVAKERVNTLWVDQVKKSKNSKKYFAGEAESQPDMFEQVAGD